MLQVCSRVILLLLVLAGAALAQSTTDALLNVGEAEIDTIRNKFKTVQTVVGSEGSTDADLVQQRTALESISLDTLAETRKLVGPLAEVEAQLGRLVQHQMQELPRHLRLLRNGVYWRHDNHGCLRRKNSWSFWGSKQISP
jgi:hypothetical protein